MSDVLRMERNAVDTAPGPLPSVCFVAPQAYGALSGRGDLTLGGGAERQQALLAAELVRRGHRVSVVVLDHGQPDEQEVRGVRLVKCYGLDRGVRGLRFVHPRLSGLWSAMARAGADVYYQRGADAETGLVAHWCRRHRRAFVFATASDTDCMRTLPLLARRIERILFRHGVRHADAVIAQTTRQQAMLRAGFGVTSTLIRSCLAWPRGPGIEPSIPGEQDRGGILWAGRISEEKRPEWVIRLARDLPGCRFDVVGPCDRGSRFGRGLAAELESLPNVRWHGPTPHAAMPRMYANARLLLCTSPAEGFPNVFLEAWSCGRGVLSTVDPDRIVSRFRIGQVAERYEDLRHHLERLDERRAFWDAAGRRGQQYVRRHHGVPVAGEALAAVLARALARSPRHAEAGERR